MPTRGVLIVLVVYGGPLLLVALAFYRFHRGFHDYVAQRSAYWQLIAAVVLLIPGAIGGAIVVFAGEEFLRGLIVSGVVDPDLFAIGATGVAGVLIGIIGYVLLLGARAGLQRRDGSRA